MMTSLIIKVNFVIICISKVILPDQRFLAKYNVLITGFFIFNKASLMLYLNYQSPSFCNFGTNVSGNFKDLAFLVLLLQYVAENELVGFLVCSHSPESKWL